MNWLTITSAIFAIMGLIALVLPLFVSGGWGFALVLLAAVAIVAVKRDISKREES